eukprot:15457284-Alexandrium_andersonii.AAC.1
MPTQKHAHALAQMVVSMVRLVHNAHAHPHACTHVHPNRHQRERTPARDEAHACANTSMCTESP